MSRNIQLTESTSYQTLEALVSRRLRIQTSQDEPFPKRTNKVIKMGFSTNEHLLRQYNNYQSVATR